MMTVESVEVEMRDHCSAGQEVLASILIRIALAAVFAERCSILALDEPRTNLNVDKVETLAEMLVDLIKIRIMDSQHKNGFQLIFITHDLRLVEHLYRDCKPEFVYGLT
ncbi:hypothetical protein L596_000196 [Steinernema carpocapsae]|uniref:ATPase AAA-type core domain-containing protein n=1 Tax=Steinernema carpocapsae TaxID=34508 RepID=A0A4U8UHJ8_STECR|nr:hypothetical protein L596_000196 [Steinernema carpocapsae]